MANEVLEDDRTGSPSAGWGWRGGFRHGPVIAGWVTVAFFVGIVVERFVSGHYLSHGPDIVLIVIAAVLSLLLIRHSVRRRRRVHR